MLTPYSQVLNRKQTGQNEPIPGSTQVANSAGGFGWAVDDWKRLERFLILGSEGGTYYISEKKLTKENAESVLRCIKADGKRAVALIVDISDKGRAPKNDPALFALAAAASYGDAETKRLALEALPKVARIGTHLYHFVDLVQGMRGWGRGLRRGIGGWYAKKTADEFAYDAVKYRQRDGWTHRDLLRLAHPLFDTIEHQAVAHYVVKSEKTADCIVPRIIDGFIKAQAAETPTDSAKFVRDYGLSWEMVKSDHLGEPVVWEALLEKMPLTAMVRNLAKMTAIGLIAPMSEASRLVCGRLAEADRIHKARLHPIAVLIAQLTYAQGHGTKGKLEWSPVPQITDALDEAFYLAFQAVEPTGKRFYLGLDVSSSMASGACAGVKGLTPRVAVAAIAMVTARTEKQYHIAGFQDGGGRRKLTFDNYRSNVAMVPLNISSKDRLDRAVKEISDLPFGGTDCALPMLDALARKIPVDTFIIYTDSETWAGNIHPSQALVQYRQAMGINARLIVCGMVSNGFTIADPDDAGMLDVVGFDTAVPQVIADFAKN